MSFWCFFPDCWVYVYPVLFKRGTRFNVSRLFLCLILLCIDSLFSGFHQAYWNSQWSRLRRTFVVFTSDSLWYPFVIPRYLTSFVTRRLFVTLANYVTLDFLDASLYASYSLLLATPISSGGLGFTPDTIGYISGIASFCHGLIQAFCFAPILKRWDTGNVYAVSIIAYILLYLMMPVTNFIARRAGRVTPTVWGLLVLEGLLFFSSYSAYGEWQTFPLDVTLFACAGCIYIFISQASPSQDALGKTYGLGQTLHSIGGAIAPATATSIIAVSLQQNLLGGALGYLILASVGVVALGLTSLMPAAGQVKPVNTNIELELE